VFSAWKNSRCSWGYRGPPSFQSAGRGGGGALVICAQSDMCDPKTPVQC